MSLRESAEQFAQATTPVPIGVSGLTILGVTVQDWVLILTAILVIFQLIVAAPKAYRTVRAVFKKEVPDGS